MKNRVISPLGLFVAALLVLTLVSGCDEKFKMDLPLAVTSRDLSLSSSAGSTHVLVYSTGDWTLHLTKDVKWASLDRTEGHGNSEFVFSYSANYGISRKVGVVITSGDLRDTVTFSQSGSVSEASVLFSNSAITLLKAPATIKAGFSTNLLYSLEDFTTTVTYYDETGQASNPVTLSTRTRADGDGDETEDEDEDEEEDEEVKLEDYADPWISNVVITTSAVYFDVTENTTGFPRTADLRVSVNDASNLEYYSVLSITQSVNSPQFTLSSDSDLYSWFSQTVTVTANSNNISPYSDDVVWDLSFPDGSDEEEQWARSFSVTADGLRFSLTANTSDSQRECDVKLSFTDELGNSASASYVIKQEYYVTGTPYPELRAMAPCVLDESAGFIEGYVVSDPTSPNVVSSPQTAQFKFDRTENYRTAYIESLDGQYGFMLKFLTEADNILERFTNVQISLDGLTLEKNDDPEFYTLSGLTRYSILDASAPDESSVPVKRKSIAEITDDDYFTLVSVTNLEIMQKDGCYTNASEGYSTLDDINYVNGGSNPRWDVAPLLCTDPNGNVIYMLTNAACPWRRFSDGHDCDFYSLLPQGSGTLRGIVVNDEVVTYRYGDVGRYQLRAMTEEEIDLNEEKFSKTVVEWTWEDQVHNSTPEVGTGTINWYSATEQATSDFNNVVCQGYAGTTSEQKGLVANGGIRFYQKWWDFDNNVGKYIDITFSTAGITGSNLIFGLVWGGGLLSNTTISGPSHWNLLYSIDGGTTFKEANAGDIIKKRAIAWWTTTAQDNPAGFTEHLRKLPSECFNQDEVILRLQVADTVTDISPTISSTDWWSNLSIEQGYITESTSADSQYINIGTITIRYN